MRKTPVKWGAKSKNVGAQASAQCGARGNGVADKMKLQLYGKVELSRGCRCVQNVCVRNLRNNVAGFTDKVGWGENSHAGMSCGELATSQATA